MCSRAEQARKGPKKTKDLSFSELLCLYFLVTIFCNFLLCQVTDTFCEVQNRAEPAGGKCNGPKKTEDSSFSDLRCLYLICHPFSSFFLCKNCSRSRRKGSKNTFLKINYSCQFNLDFYHPWEFYCSFNLKKIVQSTEYRLFKVIEEKWWQGIWRQRGLC